MIEEDGKIWLRRPKLYKGVVEPYKKKKKLMTVAPWCVIAFLARSQRKFATVLLR